MKTKDELNALKEEVNTIQKKLGELSEEELTQVIGGSGIERRPQFISESSESIDWEIVIEG